MSWQEFRMAFRTLPFLDSQVNSPTGVLERRTQPVPKLLVWHPDVINWMFRADHRLRHPGSCSLTPLFGRRSLLWSEGSRHAAYRQVLGPPLRGHRLARYRSLISEAVHTAIDALVPGTVVALPGWTRQLTLRIVIQIVLGPPGEAVLTPFTAWMENALGVRCRTLAYRYLKGGPPSSSAELDREPTIRRDVLAELAATTTDGSDVSQIPLLHAVIQEALRLTPPVIVAGNRTLTEDDEVHGRALAAGTTLTPSIYLAHRHPDRFPNPRRFDPNRFLSNRVPAQNYFPFGGGTRYCLGSQLAHLEIRMITTAVLRRCEWRCVNPRSGTPQLRGHAMAPAARLRMKVIRRCG